MEAANMEEGIPFALIYERLLARCPRFRFQPPWTFLEADSDCRGPVYDPAETLAALRGEFSDLHLQEAGVLDLVPKASPRLHPQLTNPLGALVALRDLSQGRPFQLLTARGCLRKSPDTSPSPRCSRTAGPGSGCSSTPCWWRPGASRRSSGCAPWALPRPWAPASSGSP